MLEQEFGKMKVKRGKEYSFVGMDIKFTTNDRFEIFMKEYIQERIKAYRETTKERHIH